MKKSEVSKIAAVFKVLSEPSRLSILSCLMERPHHVGELVTALGAKQANISKQLGILARAGLVEGERDGNIVRYAITNPLVKKLCSTVCGRR